MKRDPIELLAAAMVGRGELTNAGVIELRLAVQAVVDAAVQRALASPPPAQEEEMFRHVHAVL